MATIVKIFPDARTWMDEAAWEITCVVEAAVDAKGVAFVALSGGRTPVAVYERLTRPPWRERFPWTRVQWFWADERWVPPDHADSNYGSAWKAMLSKVPVDEAKVHPIPTERMEPSQAAAAYEELLRSELRLHGEGLDLAVLGMGADGHTASLFPDSPAISEQTRWLVATHAPAGVRQRISMTLPLLNATDTLMFLVVGTDKRKMLKTILRDGARASGYPAGQATATRQTIWILDSAAAGNIPTEE